MERKKVVYIAGPITGVADYWIPFCKASQELQKQGYAVLDPSNLPEGMLPGQYMRICFAMIDCADAVLFLPGSNQSPGAMLELKYCLYTGKPHADSIERLKEVTA